MARVSVAIPTFNRAHMLCDALDSVAAQTLTDWSLTVVDDGSQDDGKTKALVERFAERVEQPVKYVYQENAGVGAARNTGVEHSDGEFVAFLDSDDLWLDHHLQTMVEALDRLPQVDWICGANRHIYLESGETKIESNFHIPGRQRPEFDLEIEMSGDVHIVTDPKRTLNAIKRDHMSNLGATVFRRKVFDNARFPPVHMHEDVCFWVRCLVQGMTYGFFDRVHEVLREHNEHTAARGGSKQVEDQRKSHSRSYLAFASLSDLLPKMSDAEREALENRLVDTAFWALGYQLYWQQGEAMQAFNWFHRCLSHLPRSKRLWKTYIGAPVKLSLFQKPRPA